MRNFIMKKSQTMQVAFAALFVLISYCLTADFKKSVKIEKMTEIHGPFTELEYLEIKQEAQNAVDVIRQGIDFQDFASSRKNSTFSPEMNQNKNHTDSYICKACLWSFGKYHNLLEKKYGLTLLNEFLTLFCAVGLDYHVCKQAINLYSPTMVDSLVEHYLDAEYICTKTKLCKNAHYVELNADDYAKEVLRDKPNKIEAKSDPFSSTLKVLHVTDIHTDLLYEEGTVGLCAQPLCCREVNGKAKNLESAAGKWGYEGKCDIPLRTLDLFVEKIVNDIKPDMILFTGDNPPHNPWKENSDEIYNVTQVFVDLLYKKYQYTGAVFPTLGNHEEYIADQYSPFDMQRENDFLKDMGDIFKVWLGKEEYENFIKHGYYSSKFKNTNLRIIALNCFLCDALNFFLIRNPTDPGNQFDWMEKVLRMAEKNGEYVFIIGHIPPGDSTYLSQCSMRYNVLVDRFQNIIRGQFYGHTHYDEFRIVTEYFNSTSIAGMIYTAPSLTSYTFKNPSFRVYEVDSNTKILKDYQQYRLNLTEANLTPDIKPDWKVAYNAKTAFSIENLSDFSPFKTIIDKMTSDKTYFDFIADLFYAQGKEKNSYIENKKLPRYFSCRFNESVFDEYFKCTGYRTWDYVEYVYRFLESLSGKWYVKITEEEHQVPHLHNKVKFLGGDK